MDIDIIEEDENPMLHRTDVRFEMVHEDAKDVEQDHMLERNKITADADEAEEEAEEA